MKIVTLENASNRKITSDLQQTLKVQVEQPFSVMTQRRLLRIENFKCLVNIGLGVCCNLVGSQLRLRAIAPRRVANKRRTITDNKRNLVA